jgi:hypothetical protein
MYGHRDKVAISEPYPNYNPIHTSAHNPTADFSSAINTTDLFPQQYFQRKFFNDLDFWFTVLCNFVAAWQHFGGTCYLCVASIKYR